MKSIFTVYDSKAAAYLQPFFFNMDAEAIRAITELVQTDGHSFNLHTSDYTLFKLGTYDEQTGKITSDLESLGNLIQYRFNPTIQEETVEDDS